MNGQSDGLGSVNHVATLALSLLLALLGYFAKGMYDRQIDHDRQIVSLIEDQKAHELRDATSEKTLENVRTIQAGVIASLEALKGTNSSEDLAIAAIGARITESRQERIDAVHELVIECKDLEKRLSDVEARLAKHAYAINAP